MCTNETLYIMQCESKFVVQEYSEVTEVGPLQDECVFHYVEKVGRLEEYGGLAEPSLESIPAM